MNYGWSKQRIENVVLYWERKKQERVMDSKSAKIERN